VAAKKRVVELPRIAEPTIEDVLEEFLAVQKTRLAPRTFEEYLSIIRLLSDCLDGYGHEGLSDPERQLYERHSGERAADPREFCQLFGPEQLEANLGQFLDYFMIRKVMAGASTMRAAGTVTRKLCRWLAERGHLSPEAAEDGAARGAQAGRDLPRARRAADLLSDAAAAFDGNPPEVEDEDYLEFDHYTILEVQPGKLWFRNEDPDGPRRVGPVPVPQAASALLKPGWSVSCAMGRIRGTWRILQAANVYPD
jgi:hypothetical protein